MLCLGRAQREGTPVPPQVLSTGRGGAAAQPSTARPARCSSPSPPLARSHIAHATTSLRRLLGPTQARGRLVSGGVGATVRPAVSTTPGGVPLVLLSSEVAGRLVVVRRVRVPHRRVRPAAAPARPGAAGCCCCSGGRRGGGACSRCRVLLRQQVHGRNLGLLVGVCDRLGGRLALVRLGTAGAGGGVGCWSRAGLLGGRAEGANCCMAISPGLKGVQPLAQPHLIPGTLC